MPTLKIPSASITQEQRDWMESESERTGDSFSTIVRRLIQEKLDINCNLESHYKKKFERLAKELDSTDK